MQSLSIKFENPTEKEVEVKIYDVAGRLTKILHKGFMNRDNTLMWHGDDEQGKAVAPGVYFIRVKAPGGSITEKIVKLR
ncbi:T9SS type A sorting domain-containing protein [candidate division WOR-3 bacterium]|nr:T9SS type A sorting domain-containing protein [candidate division WOR-3 bacterium]